MAKKKTENLEPDKKPKGRPTKYKPEMIGFVTKYIEVCPDFVPSLVGLAMELGIGESTLTAWKALDVKDLDKDKYPDFDEFQGMLERLHDFQKRSALNGGANGNWNSTISKLILADHGYTDKTESNINANITAKVNIVDYGDLPDDSKPPV